MALLSPSQRKKVRDTLAAVRLVYQLEPKVSLTEATLFIAEAFLVIYQISVFGRFLDDTVQYILAIPLFTFQTYLKSPSFLSFLQLGLLWLVINLFSSLKNYLQARLELTYWEEMPSKVIAKIALLNLEDVERKEFQDLRSNVYNYSFSRILDTYWRSRQVVYELTKIVSAAVFIARGNPWIALGAFLLVLPETYYKYRTKGRERNFLENSVDQRKYADYVYNEAVQLRNFPELKVDGVFRFLLESRSRAVAELNAGVSRKRYAQHLGGFLFSVVDQFFFRLLLLSLVPIAIVYRLTVGTFQALFQYLFNLYDSSLALWERLAIIGDNAPYVGDYFAFENFAGFGDVSTGSRDIESAVPAIEMRDLTFTYHGQGRPMLRGVNFRINPGEKVALVGGDSAGKTTIVKLLCGLYRIREGDILYDGISIKDLKRGELKEKISVLFDDFVKYDFSLRENIVLSAVGEVWDPELYNRVLEVTQLSSWLKESKISDSQMLGRLFHDGVEISNGYWQRIALARTLYRNRGAFIMDEPLVHIDDATAGRILEEICRFVGERTLLVVLSSLEHARFFDRVFAVEAGQVREVSVHV